MVVLRAGATASHVRDPYARVQSTVESRVLDLNTAATDCTVNRGAGLALDEQPVAMHHVCVRKPVGHTRDDAVGGVGAVALAPARARGECRAPRGARSR